jgi:NAD(P)H dehydrogenase (quinone)
MRVLMIYAHPNSESFNHAIFENIKRGLEEGRHKVEVIDLYKEKFNPVLFYDHVKRRRDLAEDPEVAGYRDMISQADHLIFIYPIWWYGLPAILKGFIDRVFVSGFAYTSTGKVPKGLFGDKSAWVVYTIDSPSWFVRFFRHNVEWRVMKTAILKYCGIKHTKRLMFANVKKSDPAQRQKWLESVYHKAAVDLV